MRSLYSKQAKILSVYLFALLFLALFGRLGFQTINQVILWGFGPLLAFYILEPNVGNMVKIPREYYLYLSMVAFSFLGYINIRDETGFYRYLQVFIANFVLMIILYFGIRNKKDWELMWKSIGLVGIIVAFVSYFVESPVEQTDEYFRLSGFTGNANGTANYARVSVIAALVILQFSKNRLERLLTIGIILFLTYTILLTASRGNFANVIFVLGGYFVFKYFSGWRIVLLLILIFLFGNLLVYLGEHFLSDFYIFERFTRNDSVTAALDDEARLKLYTLAWEQFIEHPIFGVGLNQFHLYSDGKISHTDILDILVQLGIFAGIVYVSIYVKVLNKLVKMKKYFTERKDIRIYQVMLLCFISEFIFGISNANWFSQLQMVVLSLLIIYVTKFGNQHSVSEKNNGTTSIGLKKKKAFFPINN